MLEAGSMTKKKVGFALWGGKRRGGVVYYA